MFRKITYRRIIFATALLLTAKFSFAQDPHFSQYYASPLTLNPAIIGSMKEMTFATNYRNQWRSIMEPYVTSQISAIYPVFMKKIRIKIPMGGLGLNVMNDQAGGVLNTLGVNFTAAYNQPFGISNQGINFALQAGVMQKSIEFSKLIFGNQISAESGIDVNQPSNEVFIRDKVLYPDLGASIFWYYNPDTRYSHLGAYSGVAASHINQPNESFMGGSAVLPMKLTYNGGLKFKAGRQFDLSPNLLVMAQGTAKEINGGLYVTYNFGDNTSGFFEDAGIDFGAWYRNADALIFLVGMKHKNFSIGFSYDVNISPLASATNGKGGYEISFALKKSKSNYARSLPCPRF